MPRSYLYRPHFSGRRQLREKLRAHLADLHRAHGCFIILNGESGIGKTRLAVEFGREAAQEQVLV
ncbi:hypothetical protein ACFL27_28350, partial [candidate division CSSED10-310 bacterium]